MSNAQLEFPDYGSLPSIPTGFEDTSWHNDVCPSFTSDAYRIWLDYENEDRREFKGRKRYTIRYEEEMEAQRALLGAIDRSPAGTAGKTESWHTSKRLEAPDASFSGTVVEPRVARRL